MQSFKLLSGIVFYSPVPYELELEDIQPIDIIWNLADELSSYSNIEQKYCNKVLLGGIKDYGVPENIAKFKSQLEEIKNSLASGKDVLIHCKGGVGRTGLAVACLIKFVSHCSGKDALEFAIDMTGGPETKEQDKFVEEF